MGKIKIHAGDFINGGNPAQFYGLGFILCTNEHRFMGENISATELAELSIATEENVKRVGGALGWGAVGGALLGPAGLLAGLILGGRGKDVTFVAVFKDGRRFLGTTDSKAFTKMQAAVF